MVQTTGCRATSCAIILQMAGGLCVTQRREIVNRERIYSRAPCTEKLMVPCLGLACA